MTPPTRLVIIEDEPETLSLFKEFLGLFGFDVHGAITGATGLTLIAEHKPEVVLLDLMLPDTDGYQVCEQLRSQEETAHLPIIILSARTNPDDVRRGYHAGATLYLKKPVNLDRLLSEVQRVAAQGTHRAPSEDKQEQDAATFPPGMVVGSKSPVVRNVQPPDKTSGETG